MQKKEQKINTPSLKLQVLPLIVIIAGACVGLVGYIGYACQTRESLVFKKSSKPLTETMDLLNPKSLKVSVKGDDG